MYARARLLAGIGLGLAVALWPARVLADGPADQLTEAARLYDEWQFQAARDLLAEIDEDQLTPEQTTLRRDLLEKADQAANQQRQAIEELQAADGAFEAGRFDEARQLYERAAGNRYADEEVRQRALDQLDVLDRKAMLAQAKDPGEGQPAEKEETTPAQRESLSKELMARAQEALQAGRYADAEALFDQVLEIMPGLPEAVAGKQKAREYQATAGRPGDLLTRLEEQKAIRWQQSVATFRQAEDEVRQAIRDRKFDVGKEKLQFGRQALEVRRADAPTVEEYEALIAEVRSLGRFLEEEERLWQDEQVREQLRQQADLQERRVQEAEEARRRQIDQLINTATQLRKERKYDEAVETLRQVLAIDPLDEKARYMMEVLIDAAGYQKQFEKSEELAGDRVASLSESVDASAPWFGDVTFPRDWPEIRERRGRVIGAEETEEDRRVLMKLDEPIPEINFEDIPFEQVISYFREQMDVNIAPNWSVLETAGIDQSTEVSARLRDIRFRKALETILDFVGGGEAQLSFVVDGGVIRISTAADLERIQRAIAFARVYDITDLIAPPPDFTQPPTPSLQAVQQAQVSGSGGGGGGSSNIFSGDLQRTQRTGGEAQLDERVQRVVELIRNSIEPGTWAPDGTVGTIEGYNAQLIITHTAETHEEIRALLRELGAAGAVQVAIEARFIQVESNFFEQIGVDLDVILNNGNAGYDIASTVDAQGNQVIITDPGSGGRVLIPRQFSRLGFLPAVPATTGLPFDTLTTGPRQPYQFAGLVPATGQVAPHSSQWTPVPIGQNSINIADLSVSSLTPSGAGLITAARNNPAMQIFGSFLDNIQVDFLIRATQADQRTTTLNAPRLMIRNGWPGFIVIAQQQAYVADFEPVVAEQVGLPNPVIGVLTTGTTLSVTPTVSADRKYVRLDLEPADSTGRLQDFQVSTGSFTAGSATIQQPIIQLRLLRTSVTVPDGATVLLGGQKLSDETEVEAGVPMLSKIPILKRAFSNRTMSKNEYVLLILVKPRIIILQEIEEEAFPV
jgi:general secretion pathway protein D